MNNCVKETGVSDKDELVLFHRRGEVNELTKIVQKNPNISVLYIGTKRWNWSSGSDSFNSTQYDQVIELAQHLASKIRFNNLRKLYFREITRKVGDNDHTDDCNNSCLWGKCKVKEMNLKLLHSFSNYPLRELYVQANHIGSELGTVEIAPLIECSQTLEVFLYDGFQSDQKIDIDFSDTKRLRRLNLLKFSGPLQSILSVNNCEHLKELIIDVEVYEKDRSDIIRLLSKTCNFSLKTLSFGRGGLGLEFGELKKIFQKHLKMVHYTNKASLKSGWTEVIPMPSIESFTVSCEFFNSENFKLMAMSIPNVSWFDGWHCYEMDDESMEIISEEWSNIQYLSLVHLRRCGFGFHYLLKCKKLVRLEMSNSNGIDLKDVEMYLKSSKKQQNLKHVDFTFNKNRLDDVYEIMKRYNVENIPYTEVNNRITKFPFNYEMCEYYAPAINSVVTLEPFADTINNETRKNVVDPLHAEFRCNKAKVISIVNPITKEEMNQDSSFCYGGYENVFMYRKGETVSCDNYNINIDKVCGNGILYFKTKEAALSYFYIMHSSPGGTCIKWHDNGSKAREGLCKDGKPCGKWIGWYKNGSKEFEGTYKDGERDGIWTGWYKNGNKKYEELYKNGERDGKSVWWHETGYIKYDGSYKDGTWTRN